jgi:hypothetical protein
LASENDQQEADINLFPIFAQNGGKNEAGHAQGIPLFESEWRQLINAYQRHSGNQKQPTEILLLENGLNSNKYKSAKYFNYRSIFGLL